MRRKWKWILGGSLLLGFLFLFFLVIFITIMSTFFSSNNKGGRLDNSYLMGLPPVITEDILIASIKSYEKYNVPTAITLAQLILESGADHLSELATKDKNLFGVKYFGTGREGAHFNYYSTGEEIGGSSITIKAKFKKYISYEESIDDHSVLLVNRYLPYVENIGDDDSWARGLQRGGYGAASSYADKLISIMKTYNLYRFDGMKMRGLKRGARGFKLAGLSGASDIQKEVVRQAIAGSDPYHNGYGGLCEKWVQDTYLVAGLHYNGQHCASYSREVNANSFGEIPIGAAVYSAPGYKAGVICSCGRDAGHVGIYIGNNQIVGAQIPFVMTKEEWQSQLGYGGWYFPEG